MRVSRTIKNKERLGAKPCCSPTSTGKGDIRTNIFLDTDLVSVYIVFIIRVRCSGTIRFLKHQYIMSINSQWHTFFKIHKVIIHIFVTLQILHLHLSGKKCIKSLLSEYNVILFQGWTLIFHLLLFLPPSAFAPITYCPCNLRTSHPLFLYNANETFKFPRPLLFFFSTDNVSYFLF